MNITLRERQLLAVGLLLLKSETKIDIRNLIEDGIYTISEEEDTYLYKLRTLGEIEMLSDKLNKEVLIQEVLESK